MKFPHLVFEGNVANDHRLYSNSFEKAISALTSELNLIYYKVLVYVSEICVTSIVVVQDEDSRNKENLCTRDVTQVDERVVFKTPVRDVLGSQLASTH